MTDRMPLFPLLLAGVQSTLADVPRAVALIGAVIDAGTCTLIAALGKSVPGLMCWRLLALEMLVLATGAGRFGDSSAESGGGAPPG